MKENCQVLHSSRSLKLFNPNFFAKEVLIFYYNFSSRTSCAFRRRLFWLKWQELRETVPSFTIVSYYRRRKRLNPAVVNLVEGTTQRRRRKKREKLSSQWKSSELLETVRTTGGKRKLNLSILFILFLSGFSPLPSHILWGVHFALIKKFYLVWLTCKFVWYTFLKLLRSPQSFLRGFKHGFLRRVSLLFHTEGIARLFSFEHGRSRDKSKGKIQSGDVRIIYLLFVRLVRRFPPILRVSRDNK